METVKWERLASLLTAKGTCGIQATIRLITFEEAILLEEACLTEEVACQVRTRTTICVELGNLEEASNNNPNSNKTSEAVRSNSTISMLVASTPKEEVSKVLNKRWANNSQQVFLHKHLCRWRLYQVQICKTSSSKTKNHLEAIKPISRQSNASLLKVGVNVLTSNDAHLHITTTS